MYWHEDFGDEPSIEERAAIDLSAIEILEVLLGVACDTCERCGERLPVEDLIVTGMQEYYTMDIDPESVFCLECYEFQRLECMPSDPSLYDCLTPLPLAY